MRDSASGSMTGPISVAGSSGVADGQNFGGAAQHVEHAVGDVFLQAEQAEGGAALAGGAEGGGENIGDDLFGKGGTVDDHGVDAAGFGDEGDDRAGAGGEGAGDGRAVSVPPVKAMPAMRGSETRAAPTAPSPRRRRRALRRHAGVVQKMSTARGGGQRGLLGGLGGDGVAGGQRGGDLAGEDRQRKIPGRDAAKTPRPPRPQCCVRRSGRGGRAWRRNARAPGGIVAAEIGGFADFADAVGQGACRPRGREATEIRRGRPRWSRPRVPGWRRGRGPPSVVPGAPGGGERGEGGVDFGGGRVGRRAEEAAAVGGVADVAGGAGAGARRRGDGRSVMAARARRGEAAVGEVEAGGIACGPGYRAAGRGMRGLRPGPGAQKGGGVGDDGVFGHVGVDEAVDEAGVGAVFEQAADEVGQQILVRAHRGVDRRGRRGPTMPS